MAFDVAVTVIHCQGKVLAVYNPRWGMFTLPMTKVRWEQSAAHTEVGRRRAWFVAAVRNVMESLGITTIHRVNLLSELTDIRQSERDGSVNHYHFKIFHFPLHELPVSCPVVAEWLKPSDFIDPARQLISPTADLLIRHLQYEAQLRNRTFPPDEAPQPNLVGPRQSEGALALIRDESKDYWLVLWNANWRYYFFPGGHREENESFGECLVREMEEELGLNQNVHYEIKGDPIHVKYREFSEAAQTETDYEMELFQVRLIGDGCQIIDDNSNLRWLSNMEIFTHQAKDHRPVSPTIRLLLEKSGLIST